MRLRTLAIVTLALATGVAAIAAALLPRADRSAQSVMAVVPPLPREGERDDVARIVRVILADTEDAWARLFADLGRTYENPTLVLFTRATRTACGQGLAAWGPFYCAIDRKLYLDMSFFRELAEQHAAPGQYVWAYIIAHEVAHHVQVQLGIDDAYEAIRAGLATQAELNLLSVRLELQADCLAGVWANISDRQKQRLWSDNVWQAINAARQLGNDRLQSRAGGATAPETFTHGTSEQRVRWFTRGFETGLLASCDTFGTPEL